MLGELNNCKNGSRFLFFVPGYGKNGAATCQMWTELCEHLALTGRVEVVCGGGEHLDIGVSNGVTVRRVGRGVLPAINNRHCREVALWLEFLKASLLLPGHFDFLICADTPRFVALAAWFRKIRNPCKVVAWVMDLPLEQMARRSGKKRLGFLAKALNRLQYFALGLCDQIVVLGDCMRRVVKEHGLTNVEVIGPWADDPELKLECSPKEARLRAGFPDKFTVGYYGYAGEWHDFDNVLIAISELASSHCVQFLFAGLGPGIDRVAEEQLKHGWRNMILKGWVPRGELGPLPLCSDVHLVSLKRSMLGTCVPSKTYGALAYGRPVIFLGPQKCEAAMDLQQGQSGDVAQDAEGLVKCVRRYLENSAFLDERTRNARRVFLEKHSAGVAFQKWMSFFEKLKTKPNG